MENGNTRPFIFKGYKRKTSVRPANYVAFDTETGDDGRFITGGYYGVIYGAKESAPTYEVSQRCDTLKSFQQALRDIETPQLTRGCLPLQFVGFNTAYDLVYLEDEVDSNTRLDAGSRFISSRTLRGTPIIDVANHVIGSLDSWIERLNMYENYGIEKRHGYLESDEGKRSQVLDDARATYHLTMWIAEFLRSRYNIALPATKFSAALKIFQQNYFFDKNGKPHRWYRAASEQWKNDFERESFYGGRVEVFQRGLIPVYSYDVNSMYVSIMRDKYIPNPSTADYYNHKDTARVLDLIESGEFLTVECRVSVPLETQIGPLPYRSKELNKLIFPVGTWQATYNSIELLKAIEHGVEIIDISRALHYPKRLSRKFFHQYANMTLKGRKEAKEAGNSAMEQLFKYYGNGLFGKFGQRNGGGNRFVRLSQYQGNIDNLTIIPPMEDVSSGNDYVDAECWLVLEDEDQHDARHTFPVIPATITAYARTMLFDALINNASGIVYCDTDSMKITHEARGISISKEPGDWDFEYERTERFYRPKMYGDKVKGVPARAKLIDETATTRSYEFERPTTHRESIRRGVRQNVWEKRLKILSTTDDKRCWINSTTSKPHIISDDKITTLKLSSDAGAQIRAYI